MTTRHNIPIVDAYLRDLDRALAGRDDQAEVLESVREHIDEALDIPAGGESESERVRRVLDDLGPVERIAAALPVDPASAPSDSIWADVVIMLAAFASIALIIFVPFVAIPLAVATLTWSIVGLIRVRAPHRRLGFLRVTVVASTLSLLLVAFAAAFLLPRGQTGEITSITIVETPGPAPTP